MQIWPSLLSICIKMHGRLYSSFTVKSALCHSDVWNAPAAVHFHRSNSFPGEIPTMMRYFHLHAACVRFNNLLLSLSPILLHLERRWSRWEEGIGPSLCLSPSKRPGWDHEIWLAALDYPRARREDFVLTWTFTVLQEFIVYHIFVRECAIITIFAYFSACGSGISEFLWACL